MKDSDSLKALHLQFKLGFETQSADREVLQANVFGKQSSQLKGRSILIQILFNLVDMIKNSIHFD